MHIKTRIAALILIATTLTGAPTTGILASPSGQNAQQTITFNGNINAGSTFTLTFNGQTTSSLAFNATAVLSPEKLKSYVPGSHARGKTASRVTADSAARWIAGPPG